MLDSGEVIGLFSDRFFLREPEVGQDRMWHVLPRLSPSDITSTRPTVAKQTYQNVDCDYRMVSTKGFEIKAAFLPKFDTAHC